jgi:nitroreductase
MELFKAITARRSCRAFTDAPVSRQALDEIIAAGCAAPSALNQQPWSFTVVTDPALISELAQHCVETRDILAEKSGKGWVAKYDMSFIAAAKALIFIAADPSKTGLGSFMSEESAHVKAASACIQNMLLAITAKGLGSLWFTMYDKGHIHKTLQVAQELDIVGLLPVGVPAADMPAIPRREHSAVTTYFA